ncbi:MAG: hypothetical protein WD061_02555 [Candidatus Saccharimonadales bacterium]
MSAEQPYPGDEYYYSAAVVDQIDSIMYEIGSSKNLGQYLGDLYREYHANSTCKALDIASQIMAPKNTHSKKDLLDAKLARYSCYNGSLLGLRLSQEVMGEWAVYKLDKESRWPEVMHQVDPNSPYNVPLTEELNYLADIGYESSGQYRELIDAMEAEIMPVADFQIYTRRGFGLSMYQLARVIEIDRRKQLEVDFKDMRLLASRIAADTINLDQELDKLLKKD